MASRKKKITVLTTLDDALDFIERASKDEREAMGIVLAYRREMDVVSVKMPPVSKKAVP